MGNEHKDIKITPNTGESASPKIEVTGANNTTKTITINDDGTISFDSTIAATSGSVANGNANLVTGDAVFDYIAAQGFTTNTGDITGVDLTGGTGVTIGSETGTTSGNYSSTISIGQAVGTGDNVTFANVTIADDIIHSGDTNNLISFGTDTQSFETGGTARMNISDSGLQIGSGARVTTILDEDDLSSDSATALATQQSIKAYVDNNAGGASLANDANNRIVTATGSGGINGEANLTFDGSTLALAGKQTITVDDTVSEAFKVTITDTDSTADSTPFVVDGDGRVGIGTASPVSGFALTLNGDGTSYEGIAFQSGGSTKFKQSSDGSAMYFDSAINTGNVNFRVKDSSGNLRPALGIEGANFSVAIGYNGTSGSGLSPNNTLQVNVGTENGVQDKDDGILLLNSDLSIADGDMIGGIGFATRDGNIPSVTTEAAAAIVAYAAVAHSTTAKGGDLAFLTSPVTQSDDTASLERMRISAGGSVGIGIDDPVSKLHVKGDTSITSQTTSGAIGLTLEQDGAGDTALNFLLTGTQRWIMGIDNSDSDKFKIQTADTSLKSDADAANNAIKAMTITTAGNVGFGTNDPQSSLHVSSGTSGDAVLILEADTDNNDEADQPFIVFEQDGGVQHSAIGSFSGGNTDNNALILSNSVDNSGVQAGMIFKTGTSAGYANATESMRIYPAGETQARKTKVKAVSSNTTLGDDDSGKTIYWTGGTLTLPATAQSGQQFVIINNTNGAATPFLGTSNAIATNWTLHGPMADETARTYIAVAANTWIYIG